MVWSRGPIWVALTLVGVVVASVATLGLGGPQPEVASVLLVAAGAAAAVGCVVRARSSAGTRRRSWLLLAGAAAVAVVGNAVVSLVGDSLDTVSVDVTVGVALLLAIGGVLSFPRRRPTGVEAVTRVLDGLVGGSAALILASALVYSRLLAATDGGTVEQVAVLVIPVLDVVLVTVVASQWAQADATDRPTLALLALGFLCYTIGDLNYAVDLARGAYEFGTWRDLGWIVGYLVIALAAVVPPGARELPGRRRGSSPYGTAVIFAVILGAGVVQVFSGVPRDVQVGTGVLWLLLLVAAAARQILLTAENDGLRRGLERTVDAQTADLRHLLQERSVLIDSVGDGIYAVDVEGRVTLMNRAARELLAVEGEIDRSRHAHDLFHTTTDAGNDPLAGCYITEAITQGLTAASENDVYRRSDGTLLEVEITASPIHEDDGTVSGAVVAFRDATQRRQVERMKEQFLSVVSHELRTPLTAIRGSLGMLDEGIVGPLAEPGPRLLRMASENTERLGRLVNDILDVERLTSGHVTMNLHPHAVGELLCDALDAVTPLAESRGIALAVDSAGAGAGTGADVGAGPGPDAGPLGGEPAESRTPPALDVEVLADAGRFGQVVTNLVGNALKFSEAGTTVTLTADPGSDPTTGADVVLFGVRDQGRGIPHGQLAAVFERFRQVDSSDVRREGGMGLGLAITREIVHQMGGRIWVTSEAGKGADFWFTLPRPTPRTSGPHPAPSDVSTTPRGEQ